MAQLDVQIERDMPVPLSFACDLTQRLVLSAIIGPAAEVRDLLEHKKT